jgi:hypothetical protein
MAAGRLRAVPLVPAVPRVGSVQPFTVMTLASSLSDHAMLHNQSNHDARHHAPSLEKIPARRTLRKKGRRRFCIHFEEDPDEENPIFKPAGLP